MDHVTERLREELDAATAELREHLASWEYAFAMAGGPNGGADHPRHAATRRHTEALLRRVKDLKARIEEHDV
jgi:hypothetical protein